MASLNGLQNYNTIHHRLYHMVRQNIKRLLGFFSLTETPAPFDTVWWLHYHADSNFFLRICNKERSKCSGGDFNSCSWSFTEVALNDVDFLLSQICHPEPCLAHYLQLRLSSFILLSTSSPHHTRTHTQAQTYTHTSTNTHTHTHTQQTPTHPQEYNSFTVDTTEIIASSLIGWASFRGQWRRTAY